MPLTAYMYTDILLPRKPISDNSGFRRPRAARFHQMRHSRSAALPHHPAASGPCILSVTWQKHPSNRPANDMVSSPTEGIVRHTPNGWMDLTIGDAAATALVGSL